MNNTKWKELQMSMYNLKTVRTEWKTRCISNGYETQSWDGEWYYHFSEGVFETIDIIMG